MSVTIWRRSNHAGFRDYGIPVVSDTREDEPVPQWRPALPTRKRPGAAHRNSSSCRTGFTAEHGLHRHVRRALVLDGLLGSSGELTREAGDSCEKNALPRDSCIF